VAQGAWMVGKPDTVPERGPVRSFGGWCSGVSFPLHAPLDCTRINTGMRDTRDLTDQQWKILDHLIPEPARRRDGRGRPWKERRAVLNGILWVLRTGAPWTELPDRYPSHQTCHRRFPTMGPVRCDERSFGGTRCGSANPRHTPC